MYSAGRNKMEINFEWRDQDWCEGGAVSGCTGWKRNAGWVGAKNCGTNFQRERGCNELQGI